MAFPLGRIGDGIALFDKSEIADLQRHLSAGEGEERAGLTLSAI